MPQACLLACMHAYRDGWMRAHAVTSYQQLCAIKCLNGIETDPAHFMTCSHAPSCCHDVSWISLVAVAILPPSVSPVTHGLFGSVL